MVVVSARHLDALRKIGRDVRICISAEKKSMLSDRIGVSQPMNKTTSSAAAA